MQKVGSYTPVGPLLAPGTQAHYNVTSGMLGQHGGLDVRNKSPRGSLWDYLGR